MTHIIAVERDKNYHCYMTLADVKVGVGSQPVIKNKRRIAPPALINWYNGAHPNLPGGKILYNNQWLYSDKPIHEQGYSRIWRDYEPAENFYVWIDERSYEGSFSYIEICEKDQVIFKDGSILIGQEAFSVFRLKEAREGRKYTDGGEFIPPQSTKILITGKGNHWLILDDCMYKLEPEGSNPFNHDSRADDRQLGHMLDGTHGNHMKLYAKACRHYNIPVYYAWGGIMNSLGDHGTVSPPWNPSKLPEKFGPSARIEEIEL